MLKVEKHKVKFLMYEIRIWILKSESRNIKIGSQKLKIDAVDG
jgi:hypothetical protein